jgi:hypothetical protein
MPTPITQSDMDAVFAVTDELGIHRESITVPLARRNPGGVEELGGGQLRITLPESRDAASWAAGEMRAFLERLGYEPLP